MDKSIDEIYEEMLSVFGETSGYLPCGGGTDSGLIFAGAMAAGPKFSADGQRRISGTARAAAGS